MTGPALQRRRHAASGWDSRGAGQSIVEFALVLPLLIILMVAIVDLARIYTTMLTIESAAREAADYGTFGSHKWDAAVYSVQTEPSMMTRACVASSTLPDYVGPDTACTNPSFSYELSGDLGSTWQPYDAGVGCDNPTRAPPCWLRVVLHYDFQLLAPLNIELAGVQLGLPNTLTFERSSIFPMTDLDLP